MNSFTHIESTFFFLRGGGEAKLVNHNFQNMYYRPFLSWPDQTVKQSMKHQNRIKILQA